MSSVVEGVPGLNDIDPFDSMVAPAGRCEECRTAAREGGNAWTRWCGTVPMWRRRSCHSVTLEPENYRLNWCGWYYCP